MTRVIRGISICLTVCLGGCAASPEAVLPMEHPSSPVLTPEVWQTGRAVATAPQQPLRLVAQTDQALPPTGETDRRLETVPLGGRELTADALVEIVLERNPTLEQMTAAAVAAAARYPQVTSLDDPTFGFQTAPFSAGSPNADYAARVELSQKLTLYGKRALRGQAALSEASAAARDIDDARLQLVESARVALADYYLAEKSLGVVEENLKLIREFRQNAETRYKTGLAPQQDLLQADVEITRQEERVVSLKRARQVARARINTLAHLPADGPLPPPAELPPAGSLAAPAELRARAIAARPDLKALADRLAADAAALGLADREYKPDVELLAAYDGFWQGAGGRPLQWQIGARVNLPVRLERRDGAVMEAQAKVAQRRAELARLTDQIALQVQEAYEQANESSEVVKLYETKALPAARANVKEAQSAYVNGKVPFLSLVEAQRNLVAVRDRYYEAQAEVYRRRATLDRAIGEPVPMVPAGGRPVEGR